MVDSTSFYPSSQSEFNPRPSNTGVMEISSNGHLDYLAVTYPAKFPLKSILPNETHPDYQLTGHGRYGYRRALHNSLGVLVMDEGEERQGVHVVMSGEPLLALREMGITDREMSAHVVGMGGKVARLDVAIDIFGGALRPGDLEAAYLAGEVNTPARSGVRVYGVNVDGPSDTFYLGSRTSERFLRFYAKGVPVMGQQQVYMRLELELKKLRAQGVNAVLAVSDNSRAVINRAIHDYAPWPGNEEWSAVLAGHDVELPKLPRGDSDWQRWMKTQVIPSIVREQAEHPEENILHWVVEQIVAAMEGRDV